MKVDNPVEGSMSALITPFKNNKIDVQAYEYLIKRQIKYGMNACVPVGTTGESATLSHNEHKECIEIATSTCKGSIKVLAGAGSNSTNEAIELAQFAQKCGADAILCVSPYYNKPTQYGLYLHFKAIAYSVDIPVMIYNVPSRTGVNINEDTVLRLFNEIRNIYAIKEASGNVNSTIFFNAKIPDLKVLSGDDVLNLPIMASGGHGVISVTGNIMPQHVSKMVAYAKKNEFEEALKISRELYDINSVLFCESNPIPIKAAMYIAGLIPFLEYRMPLCHPSKECMNKIEETLKHYEVQR